jgi:hypothetical protein
MSTHVQIYINICIKINIYIYICIYIHRIIPDPDAWKTDRVPEVSINTRALEKYVTTVRTQRSYICIYVYIYVCAYMYKYI